MPRPPSAVRRAQRRGRQEARRRGFAPAVPPIVVDATDTSRPDLAHATPPQPCTSGSAASVGGCRTGHDAAVRPAAPRPRIRQPIACRSRSPSTRRGTTATPHGGAEDGRWKVVTAGKCVGEVAPDQGRRDSVCAATGCRCWATCAGRAQRAALRSRRRAVGVARFPGAVPSTLLPRPTRSGRAPEHVAHGCSASHGRPWIHTTRQPGPHPSR